MSLLLKIGKSFEIELNSASLYIRIGAFERFYNKQGLPNGATR